MSENMFEAESLGAPEALPEAEPAASSEHVEGAKSATPAPTSEPGPAAEAKTEPATEVVPAADPEPATPAPARKAVRQWVTLRNGSMDLRVGTGTLCDLPHALRSAVGRPHGCALVFEPSAPEGVVDTLRRNLSDQGFDLSVAEMPSSACDLAAVGSLDVLLAEKGVTADDLVVVVGGYETLSVASFACSSWCGGVSLAEVPLDPVSALLSGPTPRGLDLPGLSRVVVQSGSARFCAIDTEVACRPVGTEGMAHAFAVMVQTAMCDSDRAVGRLWDAADDLAAGDVAALATQMQDSVKTRGKVVASTSAAVRQSVEYGETFARALATLVGESVPASVLLADGMRFAARLGVAAESLTIDDMLAQDELLERLGVGTTPAPVDADALVEALHAERYRRSRRFMLALPRSLGRVRLSVVSDETLSEHVGAWCATRPAL